MHIPLDAEIMTQSPSQTVSIYEALAEILSKPTESLTFSNSKSTDRTLFSEARISSTTTTTTTTTTSTTPATTSTEAIDELKVENSTPDGLETIQSVNTIPVHNQQLPTTEASSTETSTQLTTSVEDLTTDPLTESSITIPMTKLTTVSEPLTTQKLTAEVEASTFSTTTSIGTNVALRLNMTDTNIQMTQNLTKIENAIKTFNNSGIEMTKTNLKMDRTNYKINSLKSSTVPPNYSPRFSQGNRIPILSFGSLREERKIDSTTKSIKLDLMTNRVTKSEDDTKTYSTPSVFPIYRPEFESTTLMSTFPMSSTSSPVTTQEVTEMIVTSSFMTLTKQEETTAVDAVINSSENESSTAQIINNFNDRSYSSTTVESATTSKNLISEINELTTLTDSTFAPTENSTPLVRSTESSTSTPEIASRPSPFKLPKPLIPKSSVTTESHEIKERIVYAILPNNTVIRKIIQQRLTTENPYLIYGILPNNTIIRKFRNGTIVPDDDTTRIEITNIDPKSLTNPNSEFYKKMAENVLEGSNIATTTKLPLTDQTKTVFYPLIYKFNGRA